MLNQQLEFSGLNQLQTGLGKAFAIHMGHPGAGHRPLLLVYFNNDLIDCQPGSDAVLGGACGDARQQLARQQ